MVVTLKLLEPYDLRTLGHNSAPYLPRFRHLDGRRVALEAPIGDPVRSALTALGHVIVDERTVAFGGAQAIIHLPRGYAGGSDPRKDGLAAGY